MEAVVFVRFQAAGKTSFYLARFFRTHVRISLDMLHTRHREALLLRACLEAKQPFVVDNTNPTAAERARYLLPANGTRFRTVGYYFPPDLETCLERNAARPAPERVPPKGVVGTLRRLEPPALTEGFDELFAVAPNRAGGFSVLPWPDGA